MKRIISLLLALVLAVSLIPAAHAASGPAESSNINDHFYINAGRFYHPIYSNLAWENGQYVRAEAIGSDLVENNLVQKLHSQICCIVVESYLKHPPLVFVLTP